MKVSLPASLYSPDQLLGVAEELEHYASGLAQRRHHVPKVTLETLSPLATEVLEQLPEKERSSDAAIDGLRQELERLAAVAPNVTLVLAASPPTKLKQELAQWLRTNVKPNILVNFHVNPEIAGGVVIRGSSRIFDCSYRTKLLEHPGRFTKVLSNV